ncbi:hypothetical protein HX089_16550 [Myroides odoratimimus]|uniref:hypothetical protein n=1 Tax=Myroides odoratimimus TaxID=76832 RepID=UPI00257508C0|nr:hypothetical protein [Myroides odoratimimus]MDM1507510.1 hypothetical protein [Myroides odoratimimus]MDM1517974.1 hypothetical protein [Myroides odoratimimus]
MAKKKLEEHIYNLGNILIWTYNNHEDLVKVTSRYDDVYKKRTDGEPYYDVVLLEGMENYDVDYFTVSQKELRHVSSNE